MLDQIIQSDLLEELSTEQEELISGGQLRSNGGDVAFIPPPPPPPPPPLPIPLPIPIPPRGGRGGRHGSRR
ncbi:hypothetical protein ACSQ6I_06720 [Anabaena sp. WFMT]|uniref:hypothetical protein n=1 Tax=Anabaena sp. WFMT TaxID=3449730 RepID=UPI003F216DF0